MRRVFRPLTLAEYLAVDHKTGTRIAFGNVSKDEHGSHFTVARQTNWRGLVVESFVSDGTAIEFELIYCWLSLAKKRIRIDQLKAE